MESKLEVMPFEQTVIEVNTQPDAVEKAYKDNHASVIKLAELFAKKDLTNIHLIGSGDSMFAGLCVQQAISQYTGIPSSITQAYEYAVFGDPRIQKGTAAFIISSSGRVSTTRLALDRVLQSGAMVIGITDQPGDENPFYTSPEHVLIPGASKLGWPTQTTTATIMVLVDLAIQIGLATGSLSKEAAGSLDDKLKEMPILMARVLNDSSKIMDQLASKLSNMNVFHFVGSGSGYGVANIGSALMAEGPQRLGVPLYVEEFHHSLRVNTIDLGAPVIVIATRDPAYERYVDTIRAVNQWGGYTVAIVEEGDVLVSNLSNSCVVIPSVPQTMNSLLTVLPLHLLSIELSRCRLNAGYQRPFTVG